MRRFLVIIPAIFVLRMVIILHSNSVAGQTKLEDVKAKLAGNEERSIVYDQLSDSISKMVGGIGCLRSFG